MNKKLFEIVTAIGLVLILLTFNPLVTPGLYFDSSGSYRFIALHKIITLSVLNIILLAIWLNNTIRSKELKITASKIYIPIFLFVLSSIFSYIFSINRNNSLLGFNSTLGSSLVELSMLLVLFFIIVNNIKDSEAMIRILRYVNVSTVIIVIWFFIRYTAKWQISSIFFKDFLNSYLFFPTGHYGTLLTLLLVTLVISTGLTFIDLIENREKNLITDSICLVILGIGFINLLHISGTTKNYFYIVALLLALGSFTFLVFNNKRLRSGLTTVGIMLIISFLIGFGSYFALTRKTFKEFNYPSVPIDVSWNVSLDSIKGVKKGVFGNGQGNFAYSFDQFKSGSLVPNNLTINSNAPTVPELRINNAGSYFIELLSSQGLLGIISFLVIYFMVLYQAVKKYKREFNLVGVILLAAFTIITASTIVTGYDFTLLLLFWLFLAANVVVIHEDEPQKNFNLTLSGRALSPDNNFNYLIPVICIVMCVPVLYFGYKISTANVSEFWAKRQQSIGNIKSYQESSADAVNKYSKSDVFLREYANARGAALLQDVQAFQEKVSKDPDSKKNQDVINQSVVLDNIKNEVTQQLNNAISLYPFEYKNYYLSGLFTSEISKYTNLSQDGVAMQYFDRARATNPTHPDTYYQRAIIYERNKDYNNAFSSIQSAITYDTRNLIYQIKLADILVGMGDYQRALSLYQAMNKLKTDNPSNFQLLKIYQDQNIDTKIEQTKKLSEEKASTDTQNKSTTPTSSPTPTPTRR